MGIGKEIWGKKTKSEQESHREQKREGCLSKLGKCPI